MVFKLSKSIKEGQKIKTNKGWRKVKVVTDTSAILSDCEVYFGDTVYGWKSK